MNVKVLLFCSDITKFIRPELKVPVQAKTRGVRGPVRTKDHCRSGVVERRLLNEANVFNNTGFDAVRGYFRHQYVDSEDTPAAMGA